MDRTEIIKWLEETDADALESLWKTADSVRRENVGDYVHRRGLIELSNFCRRQCTYCGIRAGNKRVSRYRLERAEILESVQWAVKFGYGTIVMQAGEDAGIHADWLAEIIQTIKQTTNLAVTLSLGERTPDEWKLWREAGAERYLLRFETSNKELFEKIHPPQKNEVSADRIELLKTLRALGYEIGSGVMIGIPGQSVSDLANDILLFRELQLDMIGCGPFLPHPDTPLGDMTYDKNILHTAEMPYKVIALARISCPKANIPSTTAIATIDPLEGRKKGLRRGANVIMPNLTPIQYRKMYEIYPNKAASYETPEQTNAIAEKQLNEIGRY